MNKIDVSEIFQRIERLREEGKLPKITQEDIDNEPTALAFTPYEKCECERPSENELRQSLSDTLDDYVWSLSSALTNHKLDKDDDKLTESQEKIREKIIDIIIGKTKRYYE